jgi:hypothetical protein
LELFLKFPTCGVYDIDNLPVADGGGAVVDDTIPADTACEPLQDVPTKPANADSHTLQTLQAENLTKTVAVPIKVDNSPAPSTGKTNANKRKRNRNRNRKKNNKGKGPPQGPKQN